MQVVPQTQELHFTYLPGGAEIISIDAFNRLGFKLKEVRNFAKTPLKRQEAVAPFTENELKKKVRYKSHKNVMNKKARTFILTKLG